MEHEREEVDLVEEVELQELVLREKRELLQLVGQLCDAVARNNN